MSTIRVAGAVATTAGVARTRAALAPFNATALVVLPSPPAMAMRVRDRPAPPVATATAALSTAVGVVMPHPALTHPISANLVSPAPTTAVCKGVVPGSATGRATPSLHSTLSVDLVVIIFARALLARHARPVPLTVRASLKWVLNANRTPTIAEKEIPVSISAPALAVPQPQPTAIPAYQSAKPVGTAFAKVAKNVIMALSTEPVQPPAVVPLAQSTIVRRSSIAVTAMWSGPNSATREIR